MKPDDVKLDTFNFGVEHNLRKSKFKVDDHA